MSIEEIIRRLEFVSDCIESRMFKSALMGVREIIAIRDAIALLRIQPEAQPNEPLTREELLEMSGPVWVACNLIEIEKGTWCLCRRGRIITQSGSIYKVDELFKCWAFYRRSPKED